MAGFGSLSKIARELARNPKVKEALNSPKTRDMGSKVVDRVAEAADKATKGKHQDKIQNARGQAQKHLNNPGDGTGTSNGPTDPPVDPTRPAGPTDPNGPGTPRI